MVLVRKKRHVVMWRSHFEQIEQVWLISWLIISKMSKKCVFGNVSINKYGLLTKCEVKMAGYWPSSFFCVFHKLAKKERGQYPAILTEQTWSIKDLLYGFWWNFACEIQRVVPSRQDDSILPAWVANHSARFDSSCSLMEIAI